jgi:hypothetical protein
MNSCTCRASSGPQEEYPLCLQTNATHRTTPRGSDAVFRRGTSLCGCTLSRRVVGRASPCLWTCGAVEGDACMQFVQFLHIACTAQHPPCGLLDSTGASTAVVARSTHTPFRNHCFKQHKVSPMRVCEVGMGTAVCQRGEACVAALCFLHTCTHAGSLANAGRVKSALGPVRGWLAPPTWPHST